MSGEGKEQAYSFCYRPRLEDFQGCLTFVVGVSGQPFALGAVDRSDDADEIPTFDGQVIFAEFAGCQDSSAIHGLFQSSDLLINMG